jgi:uncharacterized membrane protein (DUF373 family)
VNSPLAPDYLLWYNIVLTIFGIIVGRVCFIRKAVFAARFGDFIGNHYILFVLIEVVELFVKCIVIGTNSSLRAH